jgi:hypothetical protein
LLPTLIAGFMIMIPFGPVLAGYKIIHVPDAIGPNAVTPSIPPSEEEASKPSIWWPPALHGKTKGIAARATHAPSYGSSSVTVIVQQGVRVCEPAPYLVRDYIPGLYSRPNAGLFGGGIFPIGPETFYDPTDFIFASRIYYQRPLWDSDYFLPRAGWSERPQLWASHAFPEFGGYGP